MLPDQIDIDLPSRRDCEIELFVIVAVSVTFIVGVIVKWIIREDGNSLMWWFQHKKNVRDGLGKNKNSKSNGRSVNVLISWRVFSKFSKINI